jgi:hypothetical protein
MKEQKIKYDADRIIDSTENNEYSEEQRDETLIEENILDTELPIDDEIPEEVDETREDDRPSYEEEGYREGLI